MLMFEKNLAIARKNKGITQIELAEMLHVSNGTVGNWESGKRTPDIESVAKIASILDVTTDFLLIDKENIANRTTNNSFELSEKEIEIIKAYRSKKEMQSAVDCLLGIADSNAEKYVPGKFPGTGMAAYGGGVNVDPPLDDIIMT